MISATLTLIKKQIKKDLEYIKSFCEERNIKTNIKTFLSYKENNTTIPGCIYFFFGGNFCEYLFFNSKSFVEMYNKLPQDFKNDIGDIKRIQFLTKTEKEIEEYISFLLQEEYLK